ncbi:anti-sigma factor family protein [Corynebacterium amycolatum]|uniref:anti-sigma factor family protein n=1 Tax=Corynebacterium amycolatum TaxID=43765 RepID=UPI00211A130B
MLQSVIQQGDDKRFLSTEHLGTEAIAAFVDGELSLVAERRAQAHLMACPECRREVAKQRQAAKRLRDSAPLHIPAELRARIADFAGSCEDSEPHRSARHLAHRPPESLSAALEQIVRGFRKGGSH